jgi:hypothetical protein
MGRDHHHPKEVEMDLQQWWASLTPKQRAEIEQRAQHLKPNADLAGKHDARYGSQGSRPAASGPAVRPGR